MKRERSFNYQEYRDSRKDYKSMTKEECKEELDILRNIADITDDPWNLEDLNIRKAEPYLRLEGIRNPEIEVKKEEKTREAIDWIDQYFDED